LLAASLFSTQGLLLAWLSVAADALALLLLVVSLRRRRPDQEPLR